MRDPSLMHLYQIPNNEFFNLSFLYPNLFDWFCPGVEPDDIFTRLE